MARLREKLSKEANRVVVPIQTLYDLPFLPNGGILTAHQILALRICSQIALVSGMLTADTLLKLTILTYPTVSSPTLYGHLFSQNRVPTPNFAWHVTAKLYQRNGYY